MHLFRLCAHDEFAQLTADVIEHPEQILVWLAAPPAETFEDTQNLTVEPDGKTETRVQSLFQREGRAREITVPDHIGNPRWFAVAPDAARQADSRSKRALAGDRFKLRDLNGTRMPKVRAAQFIGRSIHGPDDA